MARRMMTEAAWPAAFGNLFDSRHAEPTNSQERATLRRALEITVEHFEFLTGQQTERLQSGRQLFLPVGHAARAVEQLVDGFGQHDWCAKAEG